MSPDRPLVGTLGNYLTLHTGLDEASLLGDFPWPPPLAHWRESFQLFEWLGTREKPAGRIFGIRRLVDQSPFRLSQLRAHGYRTESSRRPIRPPIKGSVEHYLIAQIVTPDTALVYLCMHSAPQEWYVLDEHRIVRA
jgi:hypothetical protein